MRGLTAKQGAACACVTIVLAAVAVSALVLMDVISFNEHKPAPKHHKARAIQGVTSKPVKHGHAVQGRGAGIKTAPPKATAHLTPSKPSKKRRKPIKPAAKTAPPKGKAHTKDSKLNKKSRKLGENLTKKVKLTTFPPVKTKKTSKTTTDNRSKKLNSDTTYPLKNDATASTGTVTSAPSLKANERGGRTVNVNAALPKRYLLCTVGERATSEEMMPSDGLCDLLFYTDVVWANGNIHAIRDERSWAAFQSSSLRANSTGYGISLDYGNVGDFFGSLPTPEGKKRMLELYEKKIGHYGILKAFGKVAQLLNDMHGKLGILKMLRQIQKRLASQVAEQQVPLELALGVKFQSYNSPIDISQHSSAMTALANHLPITVFVVHTHIQDWNVGKVPFLGTVWYYGSSVSHVPNEPSLRRTALELTEASIPAQTYVMPSFTMVVGEFQQAENNTNSSIKPTSMARKEITQLCKKEFGLSVINEGILKVSAENNRSSFTYEDAETMKVKAAAFYKIYHHVRQGWAVFDADFEDYENECGNGTFFRLRAFKATLSHL